MFLSFFSYSRFSSSFVSCLETLIQYFENLEEKKTKKKNEKKKETKLLQLSERPDYTSFKFSLILKL